MDTYINELLKSRKEYLVARAKGKAETIKLYTEEIAKAQESIDKDLIEIEKINKYLED